MDKKKKKEDTGKTRNRLMNTYIINVTLLTLCNSDIFQSLKVPSSGSTTDTVQKQDQTI
jgi:hypothetical protein